MRRSFDDCIRMYEEEIEQFLTQYGINKVQLEVKHAVAVQRVKLHLEENCLDKDSQDFKEYKK